MNYRHLILSYDGTLADTKESMLGPIFNAHITDVKWPDHLGELTNFWESNLFGVRSFRGSPSAKHVSVDKNLNHAISQNLFWAMSTTMVYHH